MVKSIVSKLIWLVFGLFIGSVIIFLLSQYVPFDDIENKLINQGITPDEDENFNREYEKLYILNKKNLPLFYFSILPDHYHKNIRSIVSKTERNKIKDAQDKGFEISVQGEKNVITPTSSAFHFPVLHWHGVKNQYHRYISRTIIGDWGNSRKDDKPVLTIIKGALNWTLIIMLISLVITVPLSFLLSFFLMKKRDSVFEKSYLIFSSVMFSIPGFVLATFVLLFFVSNQYGMQFFHSPLYLPIRNNSFVEILTHGFSKMAPVIFCNVISDTIFLSYLLRNNMMTELGKPYVAAAYIRGHNTNQVLIKHIFPNTLLPFITLIINSLPVALAGSVVYELVFNVPGMGKLLYDAINGADWNVVYGTVLLIMFITSLVYMLGDILYKVIDPRVR